MAINVKRLNRVRLHSVGGIEVLETLNSGDKKPAFRQNGYEVDEVTKKPFALAFDAVNSENLVYDTVGAWSTVGDIDFKLSFLYENTLDLLPIISRTISSATRIEILLGITGVLYLRMQNNGSNVVSETISSVFTNGQKYLLEYYGSKLYVNGTELADNTSASSDSLLSGSSNIAISSRLGANYQTSTVYGLELNAETMKITEGLGNKVFGSNGTSGTINTANAQGIERTNYGQWLKGDDTNGWNPYT